MVRGDGTSCRSFLASAWRQRPEGVVQLGGWEGWLVGLPGPQSIIALGLSFGVDASICMFQPVRQELHGSRRPMHAVQAPIYAPDVLIWHECKFQRIILGSRGVLELTRHRKCTDG